MKLCARQVAALFAFGLAVLAFGPGAAAGGITLTLHDGVDPDVVLTDVATPGQITLTNVTIGHFTVSGTVDGPPSPSDVGPGFLSQTQNTVNVASSGGGTLTITMVDKDLTLSPSAPTATLTSKISNSRFDYHGNPVAGASFTFQSWLNPADTTTPGGATPGLQGPFTTVPIADPKTITVPVPGAPFSLINQLVLTTPSAINLADTGTTQLQANAVPEPSSLILVAGAVPVMALALWRRRRARG
jgi:hypothetical protein